MADLGNMQAIVARSSTKPLLAVLLFRFGDPTHARTFLKQWISRVPAGMVPDVGGPMFHFMFSWNGIEALMSDRAGYDVAQGRREFDVFFVDPTQAPDGGIASQLGFLGASAPGTWWNGRFRSSQVDLAIHIGFDSPEQKADCLTEVRRSALSSGMEEFVLDGWDDRALSGCRPADGRLHFGYRDGITSPNVDWQDTGAPGSVDFREIVVGYPTEDYPTAPLRPGIWQDFARDGSFVGLSWVYQDVAGFNQFLKDNTPLAPANVDPAFAEEWVAAKLMGRWRHGSPLSRFPNGPPPRPELDDGFGYTDDSLGIKCPLGAHIRIVNCRDQPMKFANRVRFPKGPPRVMRRGFSYGPHLEGTQDDEKDRGIIGLFYFARINEQFYTLLRWMQKTDFSDAYRAIPNGVNAQDALIGNREEPKAEKTFHVPLAEKSALTLQLKDFVRYKGVVTLFSPSIAALRLMMS